MDHNKNNKFNRNRNKDQIKTYRAGRLPVQGDCKVHFVDEGQLLTDEELVDRLPLGPGLFGDQSSAQHLLCKQGKGGLRRVVKGVAARR
jgi:hypothetical protein